MVEVLLPLGVISLILVYNVLSMTLDERTYKPPRRRKKRRKKRWKNANRH